MNVMKVGNKDKEISLVKWLSAPVGGEGGNYTIINTNIIFKALKASKALAGGPRMDRRVVTSSGVINV